MRDVAEEAGLSVGALYRYFEGKEDLIRALAAAGREWNESVRASVDDRETPLDRLLALVDHYLGLLGQPAHRDTIALSVRLWGEALDNEVVGSELRESYRLQLRFVRELLREVREGPEGSGSEEPSELDAAARAVVSLLNDASLQVLIDPEMDVDAYARVVRTVVRRMAAVGGGGDGG
jgi:AcrR family transcriptional regulator